MNRRDCRLQRERPATSAKSIFDERQRFCNLQLIPTGTILIFEKNKISGFVGARIPS